MTSTVEHTPLFQVDPAKYAMRLTTTLNLLRSENACADRYRHLLEKLGGTSFDHDAQINLLTILDHNGIEDCVWSLCATEQNCDAIARLFAADCAEAVLHFFEDKYPNDMRPREAINAARKYAVEDISAAAWAAARAAARASAWAASDAARASAWAAAWAASDAAWAAARDAARDRQESIIRKYLLPDEVAA